MLIDWKWRVSMGSHYNPNIVIDGLVFYLDAANLKSYPGTGNTWFDLSGNNNNGTLTNGPTYNSANNGGSIVFDGVNDYISVSDNLLDLSGDWSFSCWAKCNNDANPRIFTMITTLDNLSIGYMQTTLSPYIRIDNTTIQGTTSITRGVWSKLTYQVNAGVREIYINSIKIATSSGGITANAMYSAIGGGYTGFTFNGTLSIANIYNRALSTTEIKQNFNAHRGRYGI